jgi:hypothetical protein
MVKHGIVAGRLTLRRQLTGRESWKVLRRNMSFTQQIDKMRRKERHI